MDDIAHKILPLTDLPQLFLAELLYEEEDLIALGSDLILQALEDFEYFLLGNVKVVLYHLGLGRKQLLISFQLVEMPLSSLPLLLNFLV